MILVIASSTAAREPGMTSRGTLPISPPTARLRMHAGHRIVDRVIVKDEPSLIRPLLLELCSRTGVDAILVTGGTGISPRDQTFETVSSLLSRPLPGYGELFRMLS